jgi:small subunit ribosomal protein S4
MVIAVREASQKVPTIADAVEFAQGRGIPPWLELDTANLTGKVLETPAREDIRFPIQEQLIVELYSR